MRVCFPCCLPLLACPPLHMFSRSLSISALLSHLEPLATTRRTLQPPPHPRLTGFLLPLDSIPFPLCSSSLFLLREPCLPYPYICVTFSLEVRIQVYAFPPKLIYFLPTYLTGLSCFLILLFLPWNSLGIVVDVGIDVLGLRCCWGGGGGIFKYLTWWHPTNFSSSCREYARD